MNLQASPSPPALYSAMDETAATRLSEGYPLRTQGEGYTKKDLQWPLETPRESHRGFEMTPVRIPSALSLYFKWFLTGICPMSRCDPVRGPTRLIQRNDETSSGASTSYLRK